MTAGRTLPQLRRHRVSELHGIGTGLAGGDINEDGYSDLMIGAPYVSYGGNTEAGVGYVIYGRKKFPFASYSLCGL